MFAADCFNKINIGLPDTLLQVVCQSHQGKFTLAKSGDNTSLRFFLTKRLYVSPLRVASRLSIRRSKGTTRSVENVSAEGSADMEDLNNSSKDGASRLFFGHPKSKEELIALQESTVRATLLRKLSDVNLYGRHLQRQLREKEDALLMCKRELGALESEIQVLVNLAQEIASEGVKPGTRKISGKYIQSYLAIKLEELHERLLVQTDNIEAACFRDVPLVWYGMAEDVKLMGSFDGWSEGIQLSPEVTGTFTKFSATLKVRPGRYQTKFLVDGDWQVSPDLPLVGEEPTINNLLVVE